METCIAVRFSKVTNKLSTLNFNLAIAYQPSTRN